MEESKVGFFYFASESVGEGHPDKLCDQISDGILDACLTADVDAKVALESATKTKLVNKDIFPDMFFIFVLGLLTWRDFCEGPCYKLRANCKIGM